MPTTFYSAISTTIPKHPVTPSDISKPTTSKSVSTMFIPYTESTSTISTAKRKSVYYSKITTILSLPMKFTITTVINSISSTTINLLKTKSFATASRASLYLATTPTTGHMPITLTRAYTAANVPASTKANSNFWRSLVYSARPVAITTVLKSSTSIADSATYTLVTDLHVSITIMPLSINLVFTPATTMQPAAIVSMRVAVKAVNVALTDASESINISFDTNFIAGAIMAGLGLLALGGTCACILLVRVTCNRVSPTIDSK